MKKYYLLIIVAILTFGFCGCEKKSENQTSSQSSKLCGYWAHKNKAHQSAENWSDSDYSSDYDGYEGGYRGIYIIDDNTADWGWICWYHKAYSSKTADREGGTIVATETYKGKKIWYVFFSDRITTYVVSSNKIIFSSGEIFTISGDKLYGDGWSSSDYLVKIAN